MHPRSRLARSLRLRVSPSPRISVLCLLSSVLCLASLARAQTTLNWSATAATTTFSSGANWVGGTAPANSLTTHIASFPAASTTNQPQFTASQSVAGLLFTDTSGDYTLSASGGAVLTLGSAGIDFQSYSGATQTISAPLALGAAATFNSYSTLDITGPVNNAGFQLTLGGDSGTNTISGVISGSGGLTSTITGDGSWILSGANTYTGQTRIEAGYLVVNTLGNVGGGASSLGAPTTVASGTIALGSAGNFGTLFYTGTGSTTDRVIDLAGAGGATLYNVGSGPLVFTSDFTATGAGAKILALAGTGSGTLTLAGRIVDHDASSPTSVYVAAGTVILSGANTYTGMTIIDRGTLTLGAANVIPDGSAVQLIASSTPAIFDLNGFNDSIASLTLQASVADVIVSTGSGTLTLLGNVTVQTGFAANSISGQLSLGTATRTFSVSDSTGNDTELTISAVISGGAGAGLTKTGAGTLLLSGANTYSGATTVEAGTLQLGHASALAGSTFAGGEGALSFGTLAAATFGGLSGSSNLALANASSQAVALTVGGNHESTTYSGALSGAGSLTKTGTGTLTLSGANTHTGGTTLSAGTLALGSTGALGSSGAISFAGGTLQFSAANTTDYSTRFSTAANQQYRFDTNGQSVTLAGALTSSGGSLTKTGTGTLTLSGANTYSGGTTLSAGTLALGSAGALGSSGTISFAGGTLQFSAANTTDYSARFSTAANQQYRFDTNGQSVTLAGALTSSGGSLTKTGGGTLTLSGANTYDGGTTVSAGTLLGNATSLQGAIVNNAAVTFDQATTGTYAGAMSGSGSLTKTGVGTLTLSGANTYVGGTTLSAGTLALGSAGALGSSGAISFAGGTLQFSAANTTDYSARFSTAANQQYRFDTSGQSVTLAGALTSSGGSLVKTGAGTLTLSGANTYAGGTTISGGTIALGHASGVGTGAVNVASGGTLNIGAFAFDLARLSGTGTVSSSAAFSHASSSDLTVTNALSGSVGFTKTGTGTLTLSGDSSYSGGTTLSAGTLGVASNTALGTGALALNGGTLQASGGARTLANAFSHNADTTISGGNALTISGAGTLNGFKSLTVASGTTATLSGAIGESTTSILIKQGAGTLELTGANTFTGGTLISAGMLRINNTTGSAFGTGAVTVASGATLTGAGSFTGALQLNGIFSPGNSPGTTATGSETWAGGATLIWEINSATGTRGADPGWDWLDITGTLTINATSASTFTLSLVSLTSGNAAGLLAGFNSAQNYTYTIASASGGILGFDTSDFAINTSGFQNPLNGGTWSLGLSDSNRNLDLNFTASAIPEPATYAALFGAAALGFTIYRRRTKKQDLTSGRSGSGGRPDRQCG